MYSYDFTNRIIVIYLYFSLTTHEILFHFEEFDNGGDVFIGLPDIVDVSDGESDYSDEEAAASSMTRKKGLLAFFRI